MFGVIHASVKRDITLKIDPDPQRGEINDLRDLWYKTFLSVHSAQNLPHYLTQIP